MNKHCLFMNSDYNKVIYLPPLCMHYKQREDNPSTRFMRFFFNVHDCRKKYPRGMKLRSDVSVLKTIWFIRF